MSTHLGLQIIQKTAELFQKEGSWTQGAAARNVLGFPVDFTSWWVHSRCLDVGLRHVAAQCGGDEALNQARHLVRAHLKPGFPQIIHVPIEVNWNEEHGRTREEVVELLQNVAKAA